MTAELLRLRLEDAILLLREQYGACCREIAAEAGLPETDFETCFSGVLRRVWLETPPESPQALSLFVREAMREEVCRAVRQTRIRQCAGGRLGLLWEEALGFSRDMRAAEEALSAREKMRQLVAGAPGETSGEAHRGTSEEASGEASGEAHRGTSEEASEKVPGGTSGDAPGGSPEILQWIFSARYEGLFLEETIADRGDLPREEVAACLETLRDRAKKTLSFSDVGIRPKRSAIKAPDGQPAGEKPPSEGGKTDPAGK